MGLESGKIATSANMNCKEVSVRIEGEMLSIRFGFDPFKKEDISFINLKEPAYLYISMFIQDDKARIILGDARTHKEMTTEVEKDIGKQNGYTGGQVYLNEGKLDKITFGHDQSNGEAKDKKQIAFILGAFDRSLFPADDGILFVYAGVHMYDCYPHRGEIIKRPFKWH